MKNLILITFFIALYSSNSQENTNVQKVKFAVYETIKVNQLPSGIIDSLKKTSIKLETDSLSPILGYVLKNEAKDFTYDITKDGIMRFSTFNAVDNEGKYCALVAVKSSPVLTNSDLQKTKQVDKNVELYFNMSGSEKWANLTGNNIGNMIAFVINDQIYCLPAINGQIKNGVALLDGINDEDLAKKISESLN